MADRSDERDRSTVRGPWPEVTSLAQIFDRGAPWCVNADGHPEYDYPDPELHVPASECRTAGLVIEAVPDLAGLPQTLEIYVARPFRFGQQGGARRADPPRLVLVAADIHGKTAVRLNVALGDALRLARHVERLVDVVDPLPDR